MYYFLKHLPYIFFHSFSLSKDRSVDLLSIINQFLVITSLLCQLIIWRHLSIINWTSFLMHDSINQIKTCFENNLYILQKYFKISFLIESWYVLQFLLNWMGQFRLYDENRRKIGFYGIRNKKNINSWIFILFFVSILYHKQTFISSLHSFTIVIFSSFYKT